MDNLTITVQPGEIILDCDPDETVLDAAIRGGLALPFGCRKGNCGTCKAKVLDGRIELEAESSGGLNELEQQQGFALLCSSYALEDVTIELDVDPAELADTLPSQIHAGQVHQVLARTGDIWQVDVDLDRPCQFRAGQFADLNIDGTDIWRSFSMAGPAARPERLSFLIKQIPGGAFSSQLPNLQPGEAVNLRSPLGSFWLRDHGRPILLVGGGAGLGPLLSMLEHLAVNGDPRPVRFFYGARTEADLFGIDEIEKLGAALGDFRFVAALSHDDGPHGHACGLVTDVVEREVGADLAGYDAYLCGPPGMIDAALAVLEGHGLEEHRSIFYDKFTAS